MARTSKDQVLQTKRVYLPPEEADGQRILVDRLWPRGLSKDKAQVGLWLKDVAPSDALRKWFHHETANWEESAAATKPSLPKIRRSQSYARRWRPGRARCSMGPRTLATIRRSCWPSGWHAAADAVSHPPEACVRP